MAKLDATHASPPLVCIHCWDSFFNTDAYSAVCLYSNGQGPQSSANSSSPSNPSRSPSVTYETSVRHVLRECRKPIGWQGRCSWCAYIATFINQGGGGEGGKDEEGRSGGDDSDDIITVYLSPMPIKACTPPGNNTFYFSVDRRAKEGATPSGRSRAGGWSLKLHAYTAAADAAAAHVTARPRQAGVDTPAAREQLGRWLEECGIEHACCGKQGEVKLPTRVVEVGPVGAHGDRQGQPRLHVAREGERGRYATFSYCWGKSAYGTLSKARLRDYTRQIDMREMPLGVQDAIHVARSMSIPYLWIDALCILQDDETDKLHQMAQMGHIYRNSLVAIVAASSVDVAHGFLRPRCQEAEVVYTIPFRLAQGEFGTMCVNELDAVCYDERAEPTNKRAWTLQEQLLAPRALIYASHTLQWRCTQTVRNLGDSIHFGYDLDQGYNDEDERYSNNLSTLSKPLGSRRGELNRWMRIVSVYSMREASVSADKLNALAGIARDSFSSSLGPGYYAGIWEHAFLWQLVWRTSERCRTGSRPARRLEDYRAPSWSWASVDGQIRYDFATLDEEDEPALYKCQLIHCETTLRSESSPFGEVLAANLRLACVSRQVWFKPSIGRIFWPAVAHLALGDADTLRIACMTHDFSEDFDDGCNPLQDQLHWGEAQYDEPAKTDEARLFCVPILKTTTNEETCAGLLLTDAGHGMFRRVGSFSSARIEAFHGLEEILITMI